MRSLAPHAPHHRSCCRNRSDLSHHRRVTSSPMYRTPHVATPRRAPTRRAAPSDTACRSSPMRHPPLLPAASPRAAPPLLPPEPIGSEPPPPRNLLPDAPHVATPRRAPTRRAFRHRLPLLPDAPHTAPPRSLAPHAPHHHSCRRNRLDLSHHHCVTSSPMRRTSLLPDAPRRALRHRLPLLPDAQSPDALRRAAPERAHAPLIALLTATNRKDHGRDCTSSLPPCWTMLCLSPHSLLAVKVSSAWHQRPDPTWAPDLDGRFGGSASNLTLARQHSGILELQAELDVEHGAAAGAASEAMLMILRLRQCGTGARHRLTVVDSTSGEEARVPCQFHHALSEVSQGDGEHCYAAKNGFLAAKITNWMKSRFM